MVLLAASIIPDGVGLSDTTLQTIATTLADPVGKVYGMLRMFTMALAFLGLLLAAYRVQMGGDLSGLGTQLVMTVLVGVCMYDGPMGGVTGGNLPRWFLDGDEALARGFNDFLTVTRTKAAGATPIKAVLDDYIAWAGAMTLEALPALVVIMIAAGFWGIGVGFIALAAVSCILIALTWVLLGVAYAGVLVAYCIQVAVLYIGLALAPLFLGMLLYEKTRDSGFKYFMGLFGILFWPLGWNLGFLVIDSIIWYDFGSVTGGPMFDLFFHGAFGGTFQALNIVLAGVLGLAVSLLIFGLIWAILTKAPGIISSAITSGAQMGTGLVSAAASGAMSGVGGAASIGMSAGMMAASGGASGAGGAAKGAAGAGGGGGAAMGGA